MKQEILFSVYSLEAYKYERWRKGTIIWYNLGVRIGGNKIKIRLFVWTYCIQSYWFIFYNRLNLTLSVSWVSFSYGENFVYLEMLSCYKGLWGRGDDYDFKAYKQKWLPIPIPMVTWLKDSFIAVCNWKSFQFRNTVI